MSPSGRGPFEKALPLLLIAFAFCSGGFLAYHLWFAEETHAVQRGLFNFTDLPSAPGAAVATTAPRAPQASPAPLLGLSPEPAATSVAAAPAPAPTAASPRPATIPAQTSQPQATPGPASVTSASSWQRLWKDPVAFIIRETPLNSPQQFQAWLKDPKALRTYFDSPVAGGVLKNPTLLRLILNNNTIVKAGLSSPALSDPQTLAALAQSPFLAQLLTKPAVQSIVEDPATMTQLLLQSPGGQWLQANPELLGKFQAQGRAQ